MTRPTELSREGLGTPTFSGSVRLVVTEAPRSHEADRRAREVCFSR